MGLGPIRRRKTWCKHAQETHHPQDSQDPQDRPAHPPSRNVACGPHRVREDPASGRAAAKPDWRRLLAHLLRTRWVRGGI